MEPEALDAVGQVVSVVTNTPDAFGQEIVNSLVLIAALVAAAFGMTVPLKKIIKKHEVAETVVEKNTATFEDYVNAVDALIAQYSYDHLQIEKKLEELELKLNALSHKSHEEAEQPVTVIEKK